MEIKTFKYLLSSLVCPVNMVADLANRLRRTFRLDSMLNYWDIKRGVRYWVIALSIALSVVLGVASFEWISPIGAMHRGIIFGFGVGWMFVFAVFLFDLVAVKNALIAADVLRYAMMMHSVSFLYIQTEIKNLHRRGK